MSAAVKYLTRKVAEAQAEFEKANAAAQKAARHREDASDRLWNVRNELDSAVNADIEKAKAQLPSRTKSGVPV